MVIRGSKEQKQIDCYIFLTLLRCPVSYRFFWLQRGYLLALSALASSEERSLSPSSQREQLM